MPSLTAAGWMVVEMRGGALAALGIRSGLSLRQVVACYPIKEKISW